VNLHAIAGPAIRGVNPDIRATLRRATGYTTAADGSRTPTYSDIPVTVQMQALSFQDIQMLDGLQINGERRAVYMSGMLDSLDRGRGTGGDLLIFPSGSKWPFGTTWLVAYVLETWPDWCHAAVTLQVD
jgi:hypothetical protein